MGDEETTPIMEERLEYLAARGAMCFPPCGRQDVLEVGNAFDLILLQGNDKATNAVTCNDAIVSFGGAIISTVLCRGGGSATKTRCLLEIAQVHGEPVLFPVVNQKIQAPEPLDDAGDNTPIQADESKAIPPEPTPTEPDQHDTAALQLLASLLKTGRNSARFLWSRDTFVVGFAPTDVYLWSVQDRVIVSDVDGTITRSNVRGVVDTVLTEQYTYCHDGVCEFLSSVRAVLLYLTSRPIGLANATRKFLSQLRQIDRQLPEGPLIGHTGTLSQVLWMELVFKQQIHEFKAAALQRNVVGSFERLGVDKSQVFVAGFGNTLTDVQAYHDSGMDLARIYLIDKQSRIFCLDKSKTSESTNNKMAAGRKEYLRMRGTHFTGYLDERLLAHVLEQEQDR